MFIGREYEINELIGLWDKRVSSLITCRGRRRVGKSTLIEEFAKVSADHFIVIEGLAPRVGMSDALQRKNFCKRLDEITGERRPVAESWPIAFARLDEAFASNKPAKTTNKPAARTTNNRFHNFEQRSYDDDYYIALEQQLLRK